MKIKLAILEKDAVYLGRIVNVFGTRYAEKFQIYSFTEPEVAMATLANTRMDVILVSDEFDLNPEKLPRRCGFAYFVDSPDIDTLNGQKTICKFQKADLIYKQILSIHSENAGYLSDIKFGDDHGKLLVFQSVSGGAGASSMAAACAMHIAKKGMRALYLNLETFGASDVFFEGPGRESMSDVIYAVKSKKYNLAMKLESSVKQDESGVYFYSQPELALNMMEFTPEEILRLVTEIQLTGKFDYIIADTEFSLHPEALKLCRKANALVWVGEGSEVSNTKLSRAAQVLRQLEENEDYPLTNRLALIYNKFSNKTNQVLSDAGIKNIGGAPRYEHASAKDVLMHLSGMEMFDKLM